MEKYNGWTNWETWNLKLWLDETGNTNWYIDFIQNSEQEVTMEQIADMLKEEYYDKFEATVTTGFFSDVVSQALSAVNWIEIAESIKESAQ